MQMEIFINILWLLIGAFFTFYAARIYYEKASEDLKKESEELKKMSQMMLQAMEHAGLAEFRKDEQGNITGRYLKFKMIP